MAMNFERPCSGQMPPVLVKLEVHKCLIQSYAVKVLQTTMFEFGEFIPHCGVMQLAKVICIVIGTFKVCQNNSDAVAATTKNQSTSIRHRF
jgi:hypothetical protein